MFINHSSKINEELLHNILEEQGEYTLGIDLGAINDDISMIEDKLKNENNKLKIKSYKDILKYLSNIKKTYINEGNTLTASFDTDGKKVGGFPFETIKLHEPVLKIDLEYLDYIVIAEDTNIIRLNYNYLMSALALELAKEDLGYEMEDIEEALTESSMVALNPSSMLNKLIDGEDLSITVSGLRIGESEYLDNVNKQAINYFIDKVRDNKSYAGMMDSTMKKTIAMILSNVLKELLNHDHSLDIHVLAVYNDEIVLTIPKISKDILEILNRPVYALILGRRFIFNTTVNIIERKRS